MPITRYWRWHIRVNGRWQETSHHECAITMKAKHPEAMPVLGSQIKLFVLDPTPIADSRLLKRSPSTG